MDKYGLFDKDGKLVHEIDNDDRREKFIGGKKGRKFPVQWILDHAYIPYIPPATSRFQSAGPVVKSDINYTREIETTPEDDIRNILISETESKSDRLVGSIAPKRKVERALAKGNSLTWKKAKHAAKPNQEPDLTPEEEATANFLASLQETTELIRVAEDNIIGEINKATGQELIDFDVENHPAWS